MEKINHMGKDKVSIADETYIAVVGKGSIFLYWINTMLIMFSLFII